VKARMEGDVPVIAPTVPAQTPMIDGIKYLNINYIFIFIFL
jgi:hypothetical protein